MDIETRTKLKIGEAQASHVQTFQSLVSVVSMALGGPSKTTGNNSRADPNVQQPKNAQQMQAAFASVFG